MNKDVGRCQSVPRANMSTQSGFGSFRLFNRKGSPFSSFNIRKTQSVSSHAFWVGPRFH